MSVHDIYHHVNVCHVFCGIIVGSVTGCQRTISTSVIDAQLFGLYFTLSINTKHEIFGVVTVTIAQFTYHDNGLTALEQNELQLLIIKLVHDKKCTALNLFSLNTLLPLIYHKDNGISNSHAKLLFLNASSHILVIHSHNFNVFDVCVTSNDCLNALLHIVLTVSGITNSHDNVCI
jgi:hypothetical protein